MNIKDIGCDILEIERFKAAFDRKSSAFIDKLLTKKEQDYCYKFKDPVPHLAARFAAKEAVAKALGIGFGKKLSFLDIEIINDKSGKPTIKLSQTAQKNFDNPKILISMSHCKSYVMAISIRL